MPTDHFEPIFSGDFTIHIIPLLDDNYCYLLEKQGNALVVDPGAAQPVQQMISERDLTLTGILLTHDHFDHTGGCQALAKHHACRISGARHSRNTMINHHVGDHESIDWENLGITALSTPGHTAHDICWHIPAAQILFTGDILFAVGCGRVFSGMYSRMWQSLRSIASLPPETHILPGHEYTIDNLEFAQAVEPDNHMLQRRLLQTKQLSEDIPAALSTIALELQTNPFLRCDTPALQNNLKMRNAPPEEVFQAIRQQKDRH